MSTIEWFPTETRLLGVSRRDGARAAAKDTGNSFEYRTGFGWAQLVPANLAPGETLVRNPDEDVVEAASPNRLLPSSGTPGQMLQISASGAPELLARVRPSTTGLPLDFSDGAEHVIGSYDMPADLLGANGFFRLTIIGRVITNADRTIDLSCGSLLVVTSPTMASGANTYWFRCEFLFQNQADEAVNRLDSIYFQQSSGGSSANASLKGADATQDTSADWTLNAKVDASGAITGTALITSCLLETYYLE